jgi:hypothetical protein
MKISIPSAKSITTILILLAGISGLPGCDTTPAPPKDAASDPATVAEGKAVDDAANQKAGKKSVKSIKNLGK